MKVGLIAQPPFSTNFLNLFSQTPIAEKSVIAAPFPFRTVVDGSLDGGRHRIWPLRCSSVKKPHLSVVRAGSPSPPSLRLRLAVSSPFNYRGRLLRDHRPSSTELLLSSSRVSTATFSKTPLPSTPNQVSDPERNTLQLGELWMLLGSILMSTCDENALEDSLCKRVMVTRGDTITKSLDPVAAALSRDALAKKGVNCACCQP
ncbi:hypothetical protein PIB30_030675 [Stylosanthes scabra]|uniref:Uncharacterized protein n=1 Tax=Stylosanthes scabra TaxID=79078 RepID=A0ABU6RC17_9FABA|nr:hypothetical protein [Stylosanthes scabra]